MVYFDPLLPVYQYVEIGRNCEGFAVSTKRNFRLLHDYNIPEGRLWLLVLILIMIAPYLVFKLSE